MLVGDALGVWFGMVKFCARVGKINEIDKEVAMHLAPLGRELMVVHIWSEANTLADALSRVAESCQGALAMRGMTCWLGGTLISGPS